ncbi:MULTISPECIES: cation-translocating P-type ATPase [unclassified Caulobacter]|uniref:cation-translocating P-type ATPase n=1 Tax=unclassified Caulobacter TaxID=2648921 RepID=UPI000D387A18|nr:MULTISPECIES: cation-translocating P-type ATPase [unclassified Caulobacter]PTS83221.1 ATPase [Caulobacter sp. HMWF009]PTT06664.1 ATPase [Caulobacter sp. HMWF025]
MAHDGLSGLTSAEVAQQRAEYGPNALPETSTRGLVRIILDTLREPMFLLLIGAAGLYLVLGGLGEGLFLMAGALATIGLVVLQEARSERALSALRDLSQPFARIIRDGLETRRDARDLVPGDIVLIGEGERLPADGVLISGDVLSIDESALTGESAPVSKRPLGEGEALDTEPKPGGDSGPYLFSGTMIVRGQAVARICHTGARTALGRIGVSLASILQEPTPLQKAAGRLVTLLGLLAIAFCAVVAVAYGLLRSDWIGGVLAGITVAIALIPEEFPMILAVFLALGAGRLARHKVLVRRSAVIEALGGATVLCLDKTGTLTENRMRVARLWTGPDDPVTGVDDDEPAAPGRALLALAAKASAVHPVDPMDRAVVTRLGALQPREPETAAKPDRTWPLRPGMMAVIQLWRPSPDIWLAAAKGAPEAIFRLCRLEVTRVQDLTAVVEGLAAEGLRVLAVASCRMPSGFPDDPEAAQFDFAGLIGFLDPVREDVPAALKAARDAGISVVMITGDHPATALAIAESAGFDVSAGVLLGPDIGALDDASLTERLRHVRIFARVVPEQKLRIVEAFKADGQVVAMTGDGVNDAPALEAANIGIAMGQKGTDVAREAADLVILDDSFASIVGGVRLGRRIFLNLRKALVYVTAIHVPIAGVALLPIIMGLPPLLYPMHVVFLELVIDPVCAMVFEAEPSPANLMQQPPRRQDEPLFGPRQLGLALLEGAGVLAGVIGLYVWALERHPENQARGAAFLTLVAGNLILALVDASSAGGHLFAPYRRVYWGIAGAAAGFLILIFAVPTLDGIFKVAPPTPGLLALALLTAIASGGWFGVARSLRRHWPRLARTTPSPLAEGPSPCPPLT